MKILDEKNEEFVKLDVEFDKAEEKMLLDYYDKHCTRAEREAMQMELEWSFVNILKTAMLKDNKINKRKKGKS